MKITRHQRARLRWARDQKAEARAGFWFTLIMWVVFFVATELLKPKPELEDTKPAGLGDFKFPTATEGRGVPLLWGTVRIDGSNVVWYGDLRQEAIEEKIKTGMFSSETIVKGYTYSLGIQFALCRGPLTGPHDAFLRMWVGDKRVFNATVTAGNDIVVSRLFLFGGNDLGNGGFEGTWKFHGGAANQAVSTYLEGHQDEGGDTPAYRGTCYLAPSTKRAYLGNSTSIKVQKFEVRRIPDGLALPTGHEFINSADANPMNVLYEIMTDVDWGLGYDATEIDTTNFTAAAATLFTEGNGFSMLLDRKMEASELIRLVEKQIEGVMFFNQQTSKWQMKLIRSDYTPAAVPNINVANMAKDDWTFSRGSWEGTTNIVRTQFTDRNDEYKTTFGLAQDTANIRIQGVNVSSTVNYPGVKDATLANNLAWRDLRTLSYPLAKATIIVDREFWDVNPGDPLTFTHASLGIVEMTMRVQRIGYGQLEDNKIRLDLVQDVFYSSAPSFGDPGATGWSEPADTLVAFPTAQQRAFEAPRALVRRDPVTAGALVPKIYAMARRNNAEAKFDIRERNASGTPAGAFQTAGTIYSFLKIGQLTAALNTKSAYPLSLLNITDNPDSETDLLAAFGTAATTTELGTEFTNLVLVDDEFMLVTSVVAAGGTTVDMENVYRGALDSVQADHAINSDVFIITSGAGISADSIPETNNVDVLLIPISLSDELAEVSAVEIAFLMAKRNRAPYPPSLLSLNTVDWDTTLVAMNDVGTFSGEDLSATLVFRRRDYRVADGNNEILSLLSDAVVFAGGDAFPGDNSTDHDFEIRHDPDGTNDFIASGTFSGTIYQFERLDMFIALNGAVPTGPMEITVTASHTDGGETVTSVQSLVHRFTVDNVRVGAFEFGLLSIAETSASYTVDAAGVHVFTLSTITAVGDVEQRINGGSWTQLIAQGVTGGSTASLSVSDTIEIRHQSTDTNLRKELRLVAPGSGTNGFACIEN